MVEVEIHPESRDAVVARTTISWRQFMIVPIGLSAMAAFQITVARLLGAFPLLPMVLIGVVVVTMLTVMILAGSNARQAEHGDASPVLFRIDPSSATPFTMWDAIDQKRTSCVRVSRVQLKRIPQPIRGRHIVFTHITGLVATCSTADGAQREVVLAVAPFGRDLARRVAELDSRVARVQPGVSPPQA